MAKKTGLPAVKPAQSPAKADPIAQHLFMDVLDLGAWLGCLWCLSRVLLPTPSGPQRFNVLGAWHAIAARGHYGRQ